MLHVSTEVTQKFMRDLGRGYPEFDYANAWHEWAVPSYLALPENVRDLFAKTCALSADLNQDKFLDMPWPDDGGRLQAAFAAIDAETLAHAAPIVQSVGHWKPGKIDLTRLPHTMCETSNAWGGRGDDVPDASPELAALLALLDSSLYPGGHWKFERYAEQSLCERAGKPSPGRTPSPPSGLEALCARLGVRADVTEGATGTPLMPDAHGYTVKLTLENRRITVPFWMGPAHEKEPTAADVLSCIVSDTTAGEQSFSDFCADFGHDEDSRKARLLWLRCSRMGKRVRRFLGDHFDAVGRAEH